MSLTATMTMEPENDLIMLVVQGTLSLETAPTVRKALHKSLAEAPDAVLVDVRGLRVDRRSRLTVFPAALHGQPGPAAVLLFGPSAELSAQMAGGVLGAVPVYATAEQARFAVAAARTGSGRPVHLRLAPTAAAAGRARLLVADACQAWDLGHLAGPATLVVSELVSNAVQHAGTDLHVAVSARRNHLHLSVRDYSTDRPVSPGSDAVGEPLPERGRGLHLVAFYTSAWGCRVTVDGKVVWATLRSTPVRASDPPGHLS